MPAPDAATIGKNLELARKAAGLTQVALARSAKINRVQIVRMEGGLTVPRLDEVWRLAEVLKVPLEFFTAGRFTPSHELRGIAVELYRLGIRDLVVSNPRVPGTFRHKEELLVAAVSGDRPDPRVVEAIPYLLLLRRFLPSFTAAFADLYDERAHIRLAWLNEIALELPKLSAMPDPTVDSRISAPSYLSDFKKAAEQRDQSTNARHKTGAPDSLGHPGTGRSSPIWRRWNITYAATMQDFLRRSIEVHAAFQATRTMLGDEP